MTAPFPLASASCLPHPTRLLICQLMHSITPFLVNGRTFAGRASSSADAGGTAGSKLALTRLWNASRCFDSSPIKAFDFRWKRPVRFNFLDEQCPLLTADPTVQNSPNAFHQLWVNTRGEEFGNAFEVSETRGGEAPFCGVQALLTAKHVS
jgi:hypothetical protein